MPYCIEYSEYDPLKHKLVSGPWEDSCEDCSFASSSSSGSVSSSSSGSGSSSSSIEKFTCDYTTPTECKEGELYMDSADPSFVFTGVLLNSGDLFKVTAYGCASCYKSISGHCDAGPDGEQFSGQNYLRLMGSISPDGWGDEFVVGSNFEGVAEDAGKLYLRIHDFVHADNQGNFCVKIEVAGASSSSSIGSSSSSIGSSSSSIGSSSSSIGSSSSSIGSSSSSETFNLLSEDGEVLLSEDGLIIAWKR